MANKMLIVTGPTGSGKTSLAVKLAQQFNGEIVSADSRQVYKFMDIGTGKDKDEYLKSGVPVWGIDLVEPDYNFNVSDFVKFAASTISEVQNRNKLPIIVGGTALYIKALLEPMETISVPPNQKLRNELANNSISDLQEELKKLDKVKWEKMNNSDRKNPRRLIRAIEISRSHHSGEELATTPESLDDNNRNKVILDPARMTNNTLLVSLNAPSEFLNKRIDQRVYDRMKQGAVEEVQNLLKMGYSFDLPSMTACGYKEFKEYFSKNILSPSPIPLDPYVQQWKQNEQAYAKRQNTFIKKLVKQQVAKGVSVREENIELPSWSEEVFKEVGNWCIMNVNDSKKT